MRIIIVGTSHPYRGGLAAFNERLAREYVKQGHEVELYTFTLQYPAFLFPGKTQYSDETKPDDLTIYREINSVNPFNWWRVGREIKSKKPEMVVFCYWMSFMAPCFGSIARVCKTIDTRVVALIHNMMPHEPSLLDKIFPRYFVGAMDGFVAMANAVADDVRKLDKKGRPIKLSPHPVYDRYGSIDIKENACRELNLNPETKYILFFGFIRRYKGLDLLMEAFADVRLRQYPVKLIVAGEFYEPEAPYRELIRRYALDDDVLLHTHFIPDSEVARYFNVADIVAQPYRSATQSGVTQIAYHFEKPMLVTDVGGLAEIVPHGKVGYVVAPDKESVADALVDFLEHNRSESFKANIQIEKKKFEWSEMSDALLKV